MLYREIIAVCSQIHTKHKNKLCGQNVELVSVKLVVHIVTAGLRIIQHVLPLIKPFHVTHTKQKAVCLQSLRHSSNAGYLLPVTNFRQHVSLLETQHKGCCEILWCNATCRWERGCAMDRAWGHVTGFCEKDNEASGFINGGRGNSWVSKLARNAVFIQRCPASSSS
jgi:hypothetical protein